MNKALAYAFALAGFAASAHAADLDVNSIKDPVPDNLTWAGVTVYGTIDVGFGYQSHGAPLNGAYPQGVAYNLYASKYANAGVWGLDPNALEQSKIGVKIEEQIGGGWLAIGRLETAFDPLSGELADGPESILRNVTIPLARQSANYDSSRQGEAFNGPAYGGVSNPIYGTLTAGRQQSLQLDVSGTYDPLGGSYAFSTLGWSSGLSGAGIAAAARQDDSVKYVFTYGPFHAAGEYAQGGPDTGFFGPAYGADAGLIYGGFSIDGVYQKVNAGVQLSANNTPGATIWTNPTTTPASFDSFKAVISDNESWSIQGKYTFDLGPVAPAGLKDGGSLKDAPAVDNPWTGKLTLFAGYEEISFSNANPTRSAEYIGETSAGGYLIGAASSTSYLSARVLDVFWTGARYALPWGLSFTGAWYHIEQNAYTGSAGTRPVGTNQTPQNAAGSYDDGSFLIDYTFNKHWDIYTGFNYSTISGGLASGYISSDNASWVSGVRLKF